MNLNVSARALPSNDDHQFLRQYALLVLVGWFFTATQEMQILGGLIAIPFLLGIIKFVHMGVLFRNSVAWLRHWVTGGSDPETGLKMALMYPLVIMWIGGIVLSALLMFVLPQFKEIFMGMKVELPIMTRLILDLSDIMNQWWSLILPLGFGIPLAFAKAFATRSGREILVPWLLWTPLIGPMYRDWTLAAFFRQWSNHLSQGQGMEESLGKALVKTSCATDLNLIGRFLDEDQVVRTARESLDSHQLVQLLQSYEREVMAKNTRRTQIVEVVSVIVMGIMIGSIVLTIFTPMHCICNCAED